ncbi:hypothetical protein ECE50_014795 [Chitinophaga sp. Mgbs1]|uniref:DUF6443 domain-containing protein n=1 Tax=Chitinophaga solisilvae TaxID=1233460 RepID=A0A9Q5D7N9_9BACT|nr:hypothetical protein [Chitinophaga solisilvae]
MISLYYQLRIFFISLLACLFLCHMSAKAGVEPYEQKLQGKLKKGDTLIVKDEKFENPAYDWKNIRNYGVVNTIVFRINRDTQLVFKQSFSCKLDMKVEYWSKPDQDIPITLQHVPLTINYDTAAGAVYQEAAQYDFKNAYKVKITINDISSKELKELPAAFILSAQVVVNRDYLPEKKKSTANRAFAAGAAADQVPMAGAAPPAAPKDVTVSWDPESPFNYDFEWTFIDEESDNGRKIIAAGSNITPALLTPMFRNNSSRVTVQTNMYAVPLIHEYKYLLVRHRIVTEANGLRTESPWVYDGKVNGQPIPGLLALTTFWHEQGLNWQYNASYAEEGKRKEVISYFDGSMHNRQTVTYNNSDGVTVAQENVYDVYGRPVANILPAPLETNNIQYFRDLHMAGTKTYSAANVFKGLTGNCIGAPDPLNTTAGAGKYYSKENGFAQNKFRSFIPDAGGLPLAVTSYTADNTGRISTQGGVGPFLQPNADPLKNRATRYYYGKPEQWELDRIFGNDVGVASHYLKNMVVDPNGQISINYQNAAGKTIATAMTGTNPDTSQVALESRPPAIRSRIPLLQPERFVFDEQLLKLSATTTYLSSTAGVLDSLRINVPAIIKKYEEKGVTICSNCYYDLTVTVLDDCNKKLAEVKTKEIGKKLPDCTALADFNDLLTFRVDKIGEYYITYELALSRNVIDDYANDFVARNTNLRTEFQFVLDQLKRENFTGCFSECVSCKSALGAKADFVAALRQRVIEGGANITGQETVLNTWAAELYDALYANCQAVRASCLQSPCDRLKKQLLEDITPGGQYALFTPEGQPLEPEINVISNNWTKVFRGPDAIEEEITMEDGTKIMTNSQSCTLAILVKYWKKEWSNAFLMAHPEFCGLEYCNSISTYKSWDDKLEKIYNTAADIPSLKPGLQYSYTDGAWLMAADKFFASGAPGANYAAEFKADLDNYSKNIFGKQDVVKNLSGVVDFLLYCADSTGNTNQNQNLSSAIRWNQCTPVAACRVPDREWMMYLQKYVQLKERLYRKLQDLGPCKGKCPVGMPPGKPEPNVRTCNNVSVDDFFIMSDEMEGARMRWVATIRDGVDLADGIYVTLNVTFRMPGNIGNVGGSFNLSSTNRTSYTYVDPQADLEVVLISCHGGATCPTVYASKKSRLNKIDYTEKANENTSSLIREAEVALQNQLYPSCMANADKLIARLTGLTPQQRADMRNKLIEVCMAGGDKEHIFGSSSVHPDKVATAPYRDYEAVLKSYSIPFSMDYNPWLQDVLTPYQVKNQSVAVIISNTNAAICNRLTALKQEQASTQPGMTFFNYLKSKYGGAMNISAADLAALEKGCANCRYLLDRSLKLPVFLDGNATGCIAKQAFTDAETALKAAFGGTVNTGHANYQEVYRNFMNQRWGFTLAFSDYDKYRVKLQSSPNEVLCNQPVYDVVQANPYQCMYDLIDAAVESGRRMYGEYIDSVKRDFRNQYVSICGKAKPRVDLHTSQQNYHYTLYYYDQGGLLLRTVPPEGVDIIQDQWRLDNITRARNADLSSCNFNGPLSNTDEAAALEALATGTTGANKAVEMWMYSENGSGAQVITPGGNNKVYFYLCQKGNFLDVAIYKLTYPSQTTVEIVGSNLFSLNVSSIQPLNPFTHVVFQGADLSDDTKPFSVFINGRSFTPVNNPAFGGCGWEITAGTTNATFTKDLSQIKQLRVYNRALTTAEIAANAKEMCMGMASAYSTGLMKDILVWGRFNTPTPGSVTTMPGSTVEVQQNPIYPKHRLSADYAYNSLGQAVQQHSADGGMNFFWYDAKGRLVASRNQKQSSLGKHSFTTYDDLSRITAVGEKTGGNIPAAPAFLKDNEVSTFLNSGTDGMITRTYYDMPRLSAEQENLWKRVSASVYEETKGTEEQTTYYSYDAVGNVKTLWQKVFGLSEMKKLEYNYDLASGKVNAVRYQYGKPDQFFYNYEYDAENKLKLATNGVSHKGDGWKINQGKPAATYQYYLHGPLARTDIGVGVQGIDYAYTLQGWLKGINGSHLNPNTDMGKDGISGSSFAPDIMAYSLNYFDGDYKPIEPAATNFSLKYTPAANDITGWQLFNGNISHSTVALSKFKSGAPVGYSYRYDQLNRLVRMRQHELTAGTTNWGLAQVVRDFHEDIRYDGNGNILSYFRNGTRDTSLPMDDMTYHYPRDGAGNLQSNRLRHITDMVDPDIYKNDIDGMEADNYIYDEIGNLIKDKSAKITVNWNVYGKIQSILFDGGSSLVYKYDPSGNRVYKEYKNKGVTTTIITKTWYIRDPQGNPLAVYSDNGSGSTVYWKEQHLYGSSRVGMWSPNMSLSTNTAVQLWGQSNLLSYELTNHLGNVMGTISDTKTITSMTDYAPFGMQLSTRAWSLGTDRYRYGFNGQERSDEIKGEGNSYTAKFWEYDPRAGRRWNLDPTPTIGISEYSTFRNNPISYTDVYGDTAVLNMGKNDEMRYVGGSWISTANRSAVNIANIKDANIKRLASDYNTLNGIADFNMVTSIINRKKNIVNLIGGGGPNTQGSETAAVKYFSELASGIQTPQIDVHSIANDPQDKTLFEGKKSHAVPTYIALGHELGHVWDILTNSPRAFNFTQAPNVSPNISYSEKNAMYWENVLRIHGNLPLRLYYNNNQGVLEFPANVNFGEDK